MHQRHKNKISGDPPPSVKPVAPQFANNSVINLIHTFRMYNENTSLVTSTSCMNNNQDVRSLTAAPVRLQLWSCTIAIFTARVSLQKYQGDAMKYTTWCLKDILVVFVAQTTPGRSTSADI